MGDLTTELRQFFSSRTLVKAVPLWTLAGVAGTIIGCVLRDPNWAQTGVGIILTSLSTNFATAIVYDLSKPDLDSERREKLIGEGLDQHDSDTLRLVAEALVDAAPEISRTIPDTNRPGVIALLETGMQDSGGVLANISTIYAAALHDPMTNWDLMQTELLRIIAMGLNTGEPLSDVKGTVSASTEGRIYGSAVGVNSGTITGTYTFNADKEDS
jgi:hypothetical protein